MSNYYEYQDAKVNIAQRLFKLNGWKVYGWKNDESDLMTDYWSPANWDGVAEKNGYILCVDVYGARDAQYYTKRTTCTMSAADRQKIQKLEAMTIERGASEQEAETAKQKIEAIKAKAQQAAEQTEEETELICPAHMAHPKGANWHIEKDGVIIDKGNGILNFSNVLDIVNNRWDQETWQKFNTMTEEEWKAAFIADAKAKNSYYSDRLDEIAQSRYEDVKKKIKQLEKFNEFINKIDTLAGGMVGKGGYTYERYTETVYKTENKAEKTESGKIEAGQHFILNSYFSYGCRPGMVYEIDSVTDLSISAYKMNGKLTKLCTGYADRSNNFIITIDKLNTWIAKGLISLCDIVEVKTPYQVEKVRKVKNDSDTTQEPEQPAQEASDTEAPANSENGYTITDGTRAGAHEIYFSAKPAAETLTALKNAGMRWNHNKKCWYGFISKEDLTKLVA